MARTDNAGKETVDSFSEIGMSVAGLANVVSKGTAELVASQNLAPLEFAILRGFLGHEEWTISEMALALGVSPSRVSRVVSRLVGLGLLRRRRLRSDRRVVRLTLTPQGRDLARDIQQQAQVYDAQLYRGISDSERASFVSTAAKILSNFAALEEAKGK